MGVSKKKLKKKCARTPSFERACKAINMHSRRPTEQCFYVLEPLRWCLHKEKKVQKMTKNTTKVAFRCFKKAKSDGKMRSYPQVLYY